MTTALETRPAGIEAAAPVHAHRWRIEEPRGPTSPGRCRECGAFRIFRNSPPGDDLGTGDAPSRAPAEVWLALPFAAYVPPETEPVIV
ncbi:MAG: hypothetical protein HY875_16245 [Chloroflexi bacterium]|nr:hypothetical protein [Chloroflexota bacterium]